MFLRTQQLARLLPRWSAVQSVRWMGDVVPTPEEIAKRDKENNITMDTLPIPHGSWQESYNKKQREYNIYLGVSALLMMATWFVGYRVGAFTLIDFNVPEDRKPDSK